MLPDETKQACTTHLSSASAIAIDFDAGDESTPRNVPCVVSAVSCSAFKGFTACWTWRGKKQLYSAADELIKLLKPRGKPRDRGESWRLTPFAA
ncbi:MAG TPA: hypothetical protein PKN33_08760 [Phycisphaerae bacterium]|nr:hypothetical protein [Phycisphaerae bacterium]